jgi:hypothetical protein
MKTIIAVIIAAASLVSSTASRAQERPSDQGMTLGLRLNGGEFRVTDVLTGNDITDAGGGLALTAGYDFNAVFGLQLELTGNGFESVAPGIDAASGSAAFLMQYRFLSGHFTRPYVRAGLAGYNLRFSDGTVDLNAQGGGVPLTVGVEFLVGRHVSLGIDVTHHIIAYEEVSLEFSGASLTYEIDADGSQTNLSMAVLFYF